MAKKKADSKLKKVVKALVEDTVEEVVVEEGGSIVEDAPEVGSKLKGEVEGSANGYYVVTKRGAIHSFERKESEAIEVAKEVEGTYREVTK